MKPYNSQVPQTDGVEENHASTAETARTLLQDCVDKAKKLIDDAIEKAKERTGQANPNACSVKVPYELIGMIIGRGGETIKD